MRDRASVVIVGGGVVGASVAYHLAQRGVTDVVMVERSALGSGSTGRSAGGVRQQFSSPVNCQLSMLSVRKLLRFQEDTGWDPRLRQVGYLFLLTRDQDWQLFQRNVEMQRSLGLDVELLTPHAAQAMLPPSSCPTFWAPPSAAPMATPIPLRCAWATPPSPARPASRSRPA